MVMCEQKLLCVTNPFKRNFLISEIHFQFTREVRQILYVRESVKGGMLLVTYHGEEQEILLIFTMIIGMMTLGLIPWQSQADVVEIGVGNFHGLQGGKQKFEGKFNIDFREFDKV